MYFGLGCQGALSEKYWLFLDEVDFDLFGDLENSMVVNIF